MPRPVPAGRRPVVLALLALAVLPGCQRKAVPTPPTQAESEATYDLRGVVRGVDPKSSNVTIRHEAVPGFMGAMTMDFTLKDPADLAGLKVGDKIDAKLHVHRKDGEVSDYRLDEFVILDRPVTLKVGDGGVSFSSAPKRLEPGDEVPDFTMTTQDGLPLKLSALRGKVVALTFIYTRCPLPDFCPLLDKKFSELADRLAAVPRRAAEVRLLSVSFDPEHDTPEVLRKHAEARGAKAPLWTFAVATHPELAKVAAPLGLSYGPRPDEIIHNLTTAVIDENGRLVKLETGKTWTPTDLFKTIYSQIPEPGK